MCVFGTKVDTIDEDGSEWWLGTTTRFERDDTAADSKKRCLNPTLFCEAKLP
jgi:hypothetical protein